MDQASSGVAPGKRLGTILVEMGYLPAADLPRWVREQVKEIVFSLFSLGEGEFRFEPGPLTSGEVITLNIPTAEVFLRRCATTPHTALYKNPYTIWIPARMNIRIASTMCTMFQCRSIDSALRYKA